MAAAAGVAGYSESVYVSNFVGFCLKRALRECGGAGVTGMGSYRAMI